MTYIALFVGLAVLGFSITYLVRAIKIPIVDWYTVLTYALLFAGGGTIFTKALATILKLT